VVGHKNIFSFMNCSEFKRLDVSSELSEKEAHIFKNYQADAGETQSMPVSTFKPLKFRRMENCELFAFDDLLYKDEQK